MGKKEERVVPVDKLRAGAKHIAHDIRRLRQAYERHENVFAWTAWYVFCRSVMDFFEQPESAKPDDICATDYVDATAWHSLLASLDKPNGYAEFRRAAHKLAAHLTYDRIKYEGDDTYSPSAEVTDYLLGVAGLFYDRLPDERKVWFGGALG